MKTIADVKRAFILGSKWHTVYHKEFAGRAQDEHGKEKILYKDKDLGVRSISIVQTTQVAFATTKADGTVKDSWIGFPKSKEVIFNENSFTVLDHDGTPVLTYSPVKDEPQTNPRQEEEEAKEWIRNNPHLANTPGNVMREKYLKYLPQTNPAPATGHTPGPWGIHGDNDEIHPFKDSDGVVIIAQIDPDNTFNKSEKEANARLIASAPELLEALKELVADIEHSKKDIPLGAIGERQLRAAKSAIQKATAN